MFFSTYILQKKGPLAKIWIAAHWEKKLTRSDIKLVDISEIVVHLINPNVPIALRTSGELLYGMCHYGVCMHLNEMHQQD